jgi:gliding motility-associated-like protein
MKTIFSLQKFSKSFAFILRTHRADYKQIAFLLVALMSLLITDSFGQVPTVGSHLGPFKEQLRSQNPLREAIHFTSRPNPVAVDLDKDGDQDVVMADFYAGTGFYMLRNDGSAASAAFNYTQSYDNPFYYMSLGNGGTPAFSDMDRDGDLDMILGLFDGTFRYYRNNSTRTNAFTQQTGVWNSVTKAGNPMNGIDLGDYSAPVFFDFDKDGDDDLIIGTSYLPNYKSIYYYVNDGEGNFSASSLQGINPSSDETTPALLDVDGDGAIDIVTGAADGSISFFKRTGPVGFTQQGGSSNPFNGINKGIHNSPTVSDLDNDGDTDIIFGVENVDQNLFYYENKGNGSFEEKLDFDSPFGGITMTRNAAPYLVDLDHDGQQEVVLGGWYGTEKLKVAKKVNGQYREDITTNPFTALTFPNKFYPSFVDIDGDSDLDLIGGADMTTGSPIEFYKNENGNYVRQSFASGPFSSITIDEGKADFVDIDKDGDFDMFISDFTTDGYNDNYFIRFFKNTGSASNAVFTEFTGTQNPLANVHEEFQIFTRFTDIDHDGDFDAVIGEGGDVIEFADGNEFSLYENTGSVTNPIFNYRGDIIPQGDAPTDPAPSFFDVDSDGDLDMLIGGLSGDISFFKNVNPAAAISVATSELNILSASGPTAVDANLTLSDADNDSLVFAQVSFSNYVSGKHFLSFISQPGISGAFDSATGKFTFTGKAPLSVYESVLRSVTVEFRDESASGRSRSTSNATMSSTISFEIMDADGTHSTIASRVAKIVSNQAPVFSDGSITIAANGTGSLDLKTLITDADNNIDLSTLVISTAPTSGAPTSIDSNSQLNLNYQLTNFSGTESVVLKVCDSAGACDQSTISITVTNTPPIFKDNAITIPFGKSSDIDLALLISDTEKNIDWNSLIISSQPPSGANVSIDVNKHFKIDYTGKTFAGTETVSLKICDKIGACDDAVITIDVTNSSPVFANASRTIIYGGIVNLSLPTLVSDAESNINFASLQIIQQPKSGASALIDANKNLIVDYSQVVFSGTESFDLKVCDLGNLCSPSSITITVTNTPPIIADKTFNTSEGSIKTIDVLPLISDAENNISLSTIEIVGNAVSGAKTKIETKSSSEINIVLDYTGLSFSGADEIRLKVCDATMACTEKAITILVEGNRSVEIYNAIAPNSSGDNRFMRIINLPTQNKIQIFNRWGDEVFSVNGYDNENAGKRFEGRNNAGNPLTSGTYFYKIEYFDSSKGSMTLTGYLSLKQ